VSDADWPTAQNAYRRLLAMLEPTVPAFAEHALALADACRRNGEPAEARVPLERAQASLPDNARIRKRLEALYEQIGEHRRLGELLAVDAATQNEHEKRAQLLVRATDLFMRVGGQAHRALETAEQARRIAADNLDATLGVARAQAALGRREESLTTLEDAAKNAQWKPGPSQARIQLEIGKVRLGDDEIFEAFDALTHAYRADPKNDDAALLLGLVALDIDDERTATRALRSVTAKRSELSQESKAFAFFQLARVAHLKGDNRSVQRMARAALKENPEDPRPQALLDSL
jgi:Flp pilus assembly protein TadD